MLTEIYKEKFDRNKPIGTIEMGKYLVMIFPRPEGGYLLRPVQSGRKDVLEKTRDLPPKSISQLSIPDPDLLEVIQAGAVIAPTVSWRAGSGLLEEPQVEISGREGFGFGFTKATLFDNEVTDLLAVPTKGKRQKTASFVFLNTTAGDIMGIVVRRNSPIMILITPTIDGQVGPSKEGLNNMLTGILAGLTSKLSTFEAQIMTALAQAAADDYFELPFDSSTMAGKLQNNLLMQVYTARTFFLCRDAQVRGTGMADPELVAHFPYLKNLGKKQGLASIFGGNGTKKLKIEPNIWDELVEDASEGIDLSNSKDRTPRPARVVPLMQRGVKIAAPQVMTAADVEAMKQRQTPQPTVIPEPAVKVEVRPQIANEVLLAIANLEKTMGGFRFVRAEKLTDEDYNGGVERLRQALQELRIFKDKVKRMRPPVTPTPVDYQKNLAKLSMFGVAKGASVLDFALEVGTLPYYDAVERSWQKWMSDSSHTDLGIRSNKERRLAKSILTSSRLMPLAEDLRLAMGLRDARMINQGIDLLKLSFLMMTEKTAYILTESGKQLSSVGQEAEINNWIHYTVVMLEKMINLGEELK